MKLYRVVLPIALIAIMLLSWYTLIGDKVKIDNEFDKYLQAARGYAEDKITIYAIENYENALRVKNDPKIYEEVVLYYYSLDDWRNGTSWCEEYISNFPKDPRGYELLLERYMKDKSFATCYDVLERIDKRKLDSEYISKVREEIKNEFVVSGASFDEVISFSYGYYPVCIENKWGFLTGYGSSAIKTSYSEVSYFGDTGIVGVKYNDELFYVDAYGNRVKVPKFECDELGVYIEGMAAVKKKDGKWVYVDKNFKQISEEYDYAGTYNNGAAAVKIGSEWKLINSKCAPLTADSYKEILLDDNGYCCLGGRIFVVGSNGKYIMLDNSGKRIGNDEYSDAQPFGSNGIAAVEKDGKWFFIDKDGKRISDKSYDCARSFSYDFAAVKINGKWGFVDPKENIVIEPQFNDAKDFSPYGSCFVDNGAKWQLLKIYRLNR